MKFYAVRAGRVPGVYNTWPQAQAQVKGFSGCQFKSFPTEAQALAFVAGDSSQSSVPRSDKATVVSAGTKRKGDRFEGGDREIPSAWRQSGYLELFTDGSCSPNTGDNPAGWGVIGLFRPPIGTETDSAQSEESNKRVRHVGKLAMLDSVAVEEPVVRLYGPVQKDKTAADFCGALVGTNNTAEISAVIHALLWLKHGNVIDTLPVAIRTDSTYVINAFGGAQNVKANESMIRLGQQLLAEVRQSRAVQFAHVRAHQGTEWNERVDQLANDARIHRMKQTWSDLNANSDPMKKIMQSLASSSSNRDDNDENQAEGRAKLATSLSATT